MKKLLNIIFTILITLLITSAGSLTHVSAAPSPSDMTMVEHTDSTSSQQHCSVSHTGITASSHVQQKNIKKRNSKDTKSWSPYYLQFTCPIFKTKDLSELIYVSEDNSTKVPIYRLYGVIRR